MDSHRDDDVPEGIKRMSRQSFLDQLQARADLMREAGKSKIAGEGDILAEWVYEGVTVRKLPDDPQGILRISVGGGDTPVVLNYCSFRGDKAECILLLTRALQALQR